MVRRLKTEDWFHANGFEIHASACPDHLKVELQTADGVPIAPFAKDS
jgi:hypothetical protein